MISTTSSPPERTTALRRSWRGGDVELAGGALLVGIGMLFVYGEWQRLFIPLQRRFARWGWPPI